MVKFTTYKMVLSNHYTAGYDTVGVDSISFVNVSPKVTTVFTSTGVNVGPYMAAVCHTLTITLPEAMPACCPSGTAPKKFEIHDLANPTIVSAPSDADMDGMELHNPSDIQTLITFWEVEKGLHLMCKAVLRRVLVSGKTHLT